MSTAIRIDLNAQHHSDNSNLRPFIALNGKQFRMSFGRRRGSIRVRVIASDLRRIAAALVCLADAYDVANGDRKVAP